MGYKKWRHNDRPPDGWYWYNTEEGGLHIVHYRKGLISQTGEYIENGNYLLGPIPEPILEVPEL